MSRQRGIPRRSFLASAVAIGGSSAMSACLQREAVSVPTGVEDPQSLPERQHAWNDVLDTDDRGNIIQPRHRVLLYGTYEGEQPPSSQDRSTLEAALAGPERAYQRSHDGLLLTISYARRYFDRFDDSLPESVTLPDPEPLAPFEDPTLDRPDFVVHLSSDHASVVLSAEASLRGEESTINGVEQPAESLTDVATITDRRTGFVGEGLPAEHDSVDGVPHDAVDENAPLFMGFKSGFKKNQASEDHVTIETGPFDQGTTQHISMLSLNLEQWYEQDDRFQRVSKMFCPHHAKEGTIEGVGDNLGTDSGIDECESVEEAADTAGVVGHSQKTATVRENDEPLMIRRDFNSTDGGRPGLHFLSLQRSIEDFNQTRKAMNGTELAEGGTIGERSNNGILQYITTEHRGNYLLPPRSKRAFPHPEGDAVQ